VICELGHCRKCDYCLSIYP